MNNKQLNSMNMPTPAADLLLSEWTDVCIASADDDHFFNESEFPAILKEQAL